MASVEWENISSTLNVEEENLESGWFKRSERFLLVPAQVLIIFELLIALSGLVFNYFVLDVSKRNPHQNSGSFWMGHVATWDTLSLVLMMPQIVASLIFKQELRTLGSPVCKIIPYVWWAVSINTNAHMVGMAIDRALNISFPDWHFPKSWKKIIPKISIWLTVIHFALVIPNLVFFELEDSVCEMRSSHTAIMRVYQVFVSIMVRLIGHTVAIAVASLVFIQKLRKRRTPNVGTKPEQKEGTQRNAESVADKNSGGKEAKKESNLNETRNVDETEEPEESHQTDFIYCGPNNAIPTNFAGAPKRGEVCIEMKEVDSKIPETGNLNVKKSGVINKGFQETEVGQTGREQTSSNIEGDGDVTIDVALPKLRDRATSSQSNTARTSSRYDVKGLKRKLASSETIKISNSNPGVLDTGFGKNETNTGKKEKKKKKKSAPVFSRENIRAIRTLYYVSLFFLCTNFTSMVLFMLKESIFNSESPAGWKMFLENFAGVLIASNHAFNFFFYLRGRCFKETFKARWINH